MPLALRMTGVASIPADIAQRKTTPPQPPNPTGASAGLGHSPTDAQPKAGAGRRVVR